MIIEKQEIEEEEAIEDADVPEVTIEKQKNTIYLSGPVRVVENNGVEWRNQLIQDYSDEFNFINPLDAYSPENHEILNDPIHYDEDSDKKQVLPSEYVTQDKIGIRQSEYVFVGLPEKIARGTLMECMYAYLHDIPLFVWTMDEQEESGWLFQHSEVMSEDREYVMEVIENYE